MAERSDVFRYILNLTRSYTQVNEPTLDHVPTLGPRARKIVAAARFCAGTNKFLSGHRRESRRLQFRIVSGGRNELERISDIRRAGRR